MSDKQANGSKVKQVGNGQIYLNGKIVEVEKFKGKDKSDKFRTRIMVPGIDEYSYPRAFDLVTNDQVGRIGEMFDAVCNALSYKADWETKPDEQTGEIKQIAQINLTCHPA